MRCGDCAEIIKNKIDKADILIHSTSIQYRNNWEEITLCEFDEQVNSNFRAALLITQTEYYEAVLNKIPVGRCGETKDCVGIIKLMCSEEGAYITSQNIFVGGGMSIK